MDKNISNDNISENNKITTSEENSDEANSDEANLDSIISNSQSNIDVFREDYKNRPKKPTIDENNKIKSSVDVKTIEHDFNNYYGNHTHYHIKNYTSEKDNYTMKEQQTVYRLDSNRDFSNFVFEKKTSRSLAYAITLCLYEFVSFSEINFLVESLYSLLPQNLNEDEKRDLQYKEMCTSQTMILNLIDADQGNIGLKIDGEDVSVRCVRFSTKQNQSKALENLWFEFPLFRDSIIKWLINTVKTKASILRSQSIKSLSKLIELNYMLGSDDIINKLITDKSNLYIISKLISILSKNESFTNRMNIFLTRFCKSSSSWLWKIPIICMVANVQGDYVKELDFCLYNRIGNSLKDVRLSSSYLVFIGSHLHNSKQLRNLILSVLNQLASISKYYIEQSSKVYLWLTYYAYIQVDKDNQNLPLIILDNDNQIKSIVPILEYILAQKKYRILFFDLLQDFLSEIENYNTNFSNNKKLNYFFLKIALLGPDFYQNVQFFLQNKFNSDCKIPKSISLFLSQNINNNQLMKL